MSLDWASADAHESWATLIKWEISRLCRGGSSSLTFPGVFSRGSIDEARDREPPKHTTSEFHQWTSMRV